MSIHDIETVTAEDLCEAADRVAETRKVMDYSPGSDIRQWLRAMSNGLIDEAANHGFIVLPALIATALLTGMEIGLELKDRKIIIQ